MVCRPGRRYRADYNATEPFALPTYRPFPQREQQLPMHDWKFPGVAGFFDPDVVRPADIVVVAVCKHCGLMRSKGVPGEGHIDLSGASSPAEEESSVESS